MSAGSVPAHAQWSPAGVPVCTAPSAQNTLAMVPDGAGGAIVAWQDGRNSATSGTDVYAQHLLQAGLVDPAWPDQGVAVCTAADKQWTPKLATDGAGGAYVVWADYRNDPTSYFGPLLYAQHVTAVGTIASGWPVNGMPISSRPVYDWVHFSVDDDGQGGAYVSWLWLPSLAGPFGIDVQRLAADGLAAGWPADGVDIMDQYVTDYTRVTNDGEGGCWVAWMGNPVAGAGLYVQRLGPAGIPRPGWPSQGKLVMGNNYTLSNTRGLLRDGRGGAFLVVNAFPEGEEFLDQRADSTGVASWGPNGIQLDTWPILQDLQMASDGSGGLFTAWSHGISDNTTNGYQVDVFRQDPAGAPAAGWSQPIFACDTTGSQSQALVSMVSDGTGGALLAISSLGPSWPHHHILAQHLDASGAVHAGWTAQGLSVCSDTSAESGPVVISDGSGGCIVAFTDGRNSSVSSVDIYAQHLLADGTVPVVSVPAGPAPGARLSVGPNPARGTLDIRFTLERAGPVRLELLDLAGRVLAWRDLGELDAGPREIRWDATAGLAPGVYWIGLQRDARWETRRIAILR